MVAVALRDASVRSVSGSVNPVTGSLATMATAIGEVAEIRKAGVSVNVGLTVSIETALVADKDPGVPGAGTFREFKLLRVPPCRFRDDIPVTSRSVVASPETTV